MTNPWRDVPFPVLWSGAVTVLVYGIPILAILIVLPASQVSGLTGCSSHWAAPAHFAADQRSVGALGIDTMGIDPGADTSFGANRLLLREHRIHLENLAGLGEMPPSGGWIIVGGIRIRGGSGSPATVFGLIP